MAQKPTSTSQGEHAPLCGHPDSVVPHRAKAPGLGDAGGSAPLGAGTQGSRPARPVPLKRRRLRPGAGRTHKVSKVGAAGGPHRRR